MSTAQGLARRSGVGTVTAEKIRVDLDGVILSNVTTELYAMHVWLDQEH
ncbi:MAG: hypothetical protein ABJB03_11275 [Rhodoglobus sp.]